MKFYLLAIVIVLIANSIVNTNSYKLLDRSLNRQGSAAAASRHRASIDLSDLFLSGDHDDEDLLAFAAEQTKSRQQQVPAEEQDEEEEEEGEENDQQQAATAALIKDYLESVAAGSSSSRNVNKNEMNAKSEKDYEAYLVNLLNKAAVLDNESGSDLMRNKNDDDEEELEMHSSLIGGHQYVSGGAGEGKQHLKPDGAVENKEEIKSDEDLPAYCDPPNPCPIGVSSDDCDPKPFAEFTAEYSKTFQEQQNCMCDDDHNECHKSNKMKSTDFLNGHNDKFTQVVAKKSPDVKRQKAASDQNETKHKRYILTDEAMIKMASRFM